MSIVRSVSVIGTDRVIYSAWETSTIAGEHSVITHENGRVIGRIGSRRPDAAISAMPYDQRRVIAVQAHYDTQYDEAYALIAAAYPGLKGFRRDGQVEAQV